MCSGSCSRSKPSSLICQLLLLSVICCLFLLTISFQLLQNASSVLHPNALESDDQIPRSPCFQRAFNMQERAKSAIEGQNAKMWPCTGTTERLLEMFLQSVPCLFLFLSLTIFLKRVASAHHTNFSFPIDPSTDHSLTETP